MPHNSKAVKVNPISMITLTKSKGVWKLNVDGCEVTSKEFKVIVKFLAALQEQSKL